MNIGDPDDGASEAYSIKIKDLTLEHFGSSSSQTGESCCCPLDRKTHLCLLRITISLCDVDVFPFAAVVCVWWIALVVLAALPSLASGHLLHHNNRQASKREVGVEKLSKVINTHQFFALKFSFSSTWWFSLHNFTTQKSTLSLSRRIIINISLAFCKEKN